MSKGLNILITTGDGIGHVNSCIGIGESLVRAGHRVMFLINEQWRGRLTKYGIEEVLYESWTENKESDKNMALKAAMSAKRIGLMTDRSPLEKMVAYWGQLFPDMTQKWPKTDKMIERYIDKLCPDLIIIDHVVYHTSVVKSGIPWVWVCSCNPLLLIDDNRTPPHGSGFPIDSDENEWKIFRQTVKDVTIESSKRFNEYIIARGLKALNDCQYFTPSPYLNVYPFPAELDYNDVRPLPPNHYRFDNFMRTHNDIKFEIPLPLRYKPGRLIYFSLGSMGAADVDNMKRLVDILSKSKHRFIVSKGPLHDEYSLTDNMWGEGSVPQIQVLPLVDLVITHGGNNTVTETFYFGKPMIVLPLWTDQYDNAQRVHEKGFGIRLDAYKCSEEELLNAIESLLNNKELNEKLMKISQRIQSDNSIAKLPTIIEKLFFNTNRNNN